MSKKALPSVESIVSSAWTRTKARFLSFFLATLMAWGLFAIVGAAAIVCAVLLTALSAGLAPTAKLMLSIAGGALMIFGLMYAAAWAGLATVTVIANPEKIGVFEAYKKVKPLILRFVWVQFLTGIFFIGLFPVSAVLLFIPLLAWYIWGGFMVFVYLDRKKKGLENLWISQAMVRQNFWGVAGRLLLLFGASILFAFLVSSSRSGLVMLVWQLVNLLIIGPFSVSYLYEIYSHLDKKESAPAPTVWVTASAIGFVITVLAAGALIRIGGDKLPKLMQKRYQKQLEKQMPPSGTPEIPYGEDAI